MFASPVQSNRLERFEDWLVWVLLKCCIAQLDGTLHDDDNLWSLC